MGGTYKWPSLAEVSEYRERVKEVVIEVIENAPLALPVNQDHPWVRKSGCGYVFVPLYSGVSLWDLNMKGERSCTLY